MGSHSGVVDVIATMDQYSQKLYDAIMEKLGDDKAALKAFDVGEYVAPNAQAQEDYMRLGKRLFNVVGALGLNDDGTGWKAFNVQIEEGLSVEQDAAVAESLAHQCLICVSKMKRERRPAAEI